MANTSFEIELQVRDYECDLQGIVNNAVYLNYFEHARHEYLASLGVDFAALHVQGIDPVVTRLELDYRAPLKSRDRFVVGLRVLRHGRLRFVFRQWIARKPESQVAAQAVVTAVFLQDGKPVPPPQQIVDAMKGSVAFQEAMSHSIRRVDMGPAE